MSNPTVVLVHGAFADASGWAGVIRELQADGITAIAPPNPLRGIVSDAVGIRALVSAIDGPVVLVGHSYGGAVIGQASTGLSNVKALVYVAAFALDEGESILSLTESYAATLLGPNTRPTSYDAPGAAGGPDLYLDRDGFRATFCADLSVDVAAVLGASQRPAAAAALTEPAGAPGWKDIPSWYLVAEEDNTINPDAERFMAERMKATTGSIDASHLAFVSRPVEVAQFIKGAL